MLLAAAVAVLAVLVLALALSGVLSPSRVSPRAIAVLPAPPAAALAAVAIAGAPLTEEQYFLVPDGVEEIEVANHDYWS